MGDGYDRPKRPNQSGDAPGGSSRPRPPSGSRPQGNGNGNDRRQGGGGGLLSRYGNNRGGESQTDTGVRGAWQALTGQARRLGDNILKAAGGERNPRAGNWKATDFDSRTLEDWDRHDAAPFELPPGEDGEVYARERDREQRIARYDNPRRSGHDDSQQYSAPHSAPRGAGRRASNPREERRWRGWNDREDGWGQDEWDAGWETGTWDTGWATGFQPSMEHGRPGSPADRGGFWAPGRGGVEPHDDALSQSLGTLAQLGSVSGTPISRLSRIRMLMRRRPAAAAMLAFFLLGFMLTCCAPTIPLLRLGYDAADAARRVSNIQTIFAGGSSALFNGAKLKDAQAEVDGITHDLYEINGAMNVAGAPLAAISPAMKNYRLLVRMGFDLTASADEGLNVAQTLLVPLQGGALSSDASTPGLTMANIQQARGVMSDATLRLQDALDAYAALDVGALPAQLKPDSKYGKMLGLLPTAQAALGEVSRLLDIAPDLLGIGKPADYLVIAMDRSELRPGGGFQGNYGILELDGGKQSKTRQFGLHDVYGLDQSYFKTVHSPDEPCGTNMPDPPAYYWWWPYTWDETCTIDWGLRDSNLSPDFPTNARTAISIVKQAGYVPNNGDLQGVIAFTPVLIADLLSVTGDLPMPDWGVTVTSKNLENVIHQYQLGNKQPKGVDRKEFTHQLSQRLLDRIKTMHGSALKPVLEIAQKALREKDLQIYFDQPRAELILQQLGLASQIRTGEGDGFFVVDTNFGGNKANTYVTEQQTDYVTLLPDGGALHRLRIAVTYDKKGDVYDISQAKNYNELQRTYLPGDATILGYSGFNPPIFSGGGCKGSSGSPIISCNYDGTPKITTPVTVSDVPGRTMVMGPLTVTCGASQNPYAYRPAQLDEECRTNPQPHTQTIYIEWYTPNAFTMDAAGHGTYTEVVERQPGNQESVAVFVDTSQLYKGQPSLGDYTFSNGDADTAFAALIENKKPAYAMQPLVTNTEVSVNF